METNVTEALQKVKAKGYTQAKISKLLSVNQSTISRLIRGLPKAFYSKGIRENPNGIRTNLNILNTCNSILYGTEVKVAEYIENKPILFKKNKESTYNSNRILKRPGMIEFYCKALKYLGANNMNMGNHIVLAGLGEDTRELLYWEYNPNNIHAIDRDKTKLDNLDKYNINLHHGEFIDIISKIDNIVTINADFMGNLCNQNTQYITDTYLTLEKIAKLNLHNVAIYITYGCRGLKEWQRIHNRFKLDSLFGSKNILIKHNTYGPSSYNKNTKEIYKKIGPSMYTVGYAIK